jgi:hypothetical protein
MANRCGLIYVNSSDDLEVFSLPMVKQIPRKRALLSGPLQGAVDDDGTQIGLALISVGKSESGNSAMAKMRINRKASAIGSAIRAHLSLDQVAPVVESRRRKTTAAPQLPPL